MTRPRIYLAGPEVFFPEPLVLAEERKGFLAAHGLEGLFPLDNQVHAESPGETARAIFVANCRLIDAADAVLANMTPFRGPSTDVGTAWEIGYAFAQGKPVFGFSEDLSLYHEKVHLHGWLAEETSARDRNDHEVEMFGGIDNLMLTQSVAGVGGTFEEAVLALRDYLRGSERP